MKGRFVWIGEFRNRLLSALIKAVTVFSLFILPYTTVPALAQVVVERSKDKAIIGGESYYLHIVKKGETAYSISRAYGISVDQLEHENPSAGINLREGMSLRIPVKIVTAAPAGQPVPYRHSVHNDDKYVYHVLDKGETIFSLSRKYQVTEQEIRDANPGLDVTRITLGSEIAIPLKVHEVVKSVPPDVTVKEQQSKVHQVVEPVESAESVEGYQHKVSDGETLSSIARKYRISLRDLKRANRNVRFPKVGDYLIIPGMEARKKVVVDEVLPDTLKEIADTLNIQYEKPEEYVHIHSLRGSVDVAVLLPFYLNENARRTETDSSRIIKGRKDYRSITRPEDWLYPPSIEFVEMYEGILMAVDTLRSAGLDINLHTYDIQSDTVEVTRLIRSGALSVMDLIIGPVYPRNLAIVADYARDLEIPVVSPVSLFSNSPLDGNPHLFMAGSSLEVVQRAIARKVTGYSRQNIVLIHSSYPEEHNDIEWFKRVISREHAKIHPYDSIRIRSIPYYSSSEYRADSLPRLSRALSAETGNIVIIASESAPVISESVMEVRNLSRKYDIKVFGYPLMRELSNIDPKFLFDLGIMVYSPYWIDYSSEDVKKFNSGFRKKFYTEPPQESYAWQGYDIAYYFMSGIALHGRNFILHPQIHNPDLLHTDFDFRRKGLSDGFENQKLYLIRYTSDYNTEVVQDDNPEASRPQND